ncbi:AAA family ATPase [Plantactinospora sp. S1510]|uniref:AAA family ATPase n=1 Tax=Plantactinospora alkalitolerans TaxID=2789879 RepID=A0ABS0H8J7_9ACTN|nr:AAA family ATPase [Plantactinospora alkalitolerans]
MGRKATLDVLSREMATVTRGAGRCVLIQGPIGIGKSRLLEEGTALAVAHGMAVIPGRASALDRAAPLSTLVPFTSGVPTRADHATLSSDLNGHEPNPVELVRALSEQLGRSATNQPVVLLLDDAQWIDHLSAVVLAALVPALAHSRILWLVASRAPRPDAPGRVVIDRLVDEGACRLPLGPLDEQSVAELCLTVLRNPPGPQLLALANRAGGNPFLLNELLGTVARHGRWDEMPTTFLDEVDRRLHDLTDEARRLLQACAVLDRPFTVHEAAGLVGRGAVDVVPATTELVDAGMLTDRGGELDFHQDLVREAVYRRTCRPVRLALHREAARMAQQEGRPPDEVAVHLSRGGRPVEPEPATRARPAAGPKAPNRPVPRPRTPVRPGPAGEPTGPPPAGPDPAAAADVVVHVLDQLGEQGADRPQLIAEAVRILASAGRLPEARQLGELALGAGLAPQAEARLLLGLAEAVQCVGDNVAAVHYSRRALDRPGLPTAIRAELLTVQAHAQLVGADPVESGVRQPVEMVHHDRPYLPASDPVDPTCPPQPWLWLARGLTGADRLAEADVVYTAARRGAARFGPDWSQALWHYHRAELCAAAGRLAEAGDEAGAALDLVDNDAPPQLLVVLRALLAQIAIRRDDLAVARTHLRHAPATDGSVGVPAVNLAWASAALDEAGGEPAAALDKLAWVYAGTASRALLLTEQPQAAPALVRIARRAGEQSMAEAVAATARCLADHNPSVASLAGAAAHADGVLRGDLPALRRAVDHFRTSTRPLARASALEDAARAEQGAGNLTEAAALLGEAVETYGRSGATYDVVRARRLLCGVNLAAPPRPVEGWLSLTQSELRVVEVIAEGMTNREAANRLFLSPHTVDSHLRHVFAKLGINSRVELTRQYLANTLSAA